MWSKEENNGEPCPQEALLDTIGLYLDEPAAYSRALRHVLIIAFRGRGGYYYGQTSGQGISWPLSIRAKHGTVMHALAFLSHRTVTIIETNE